ncbi:MAG TPA: class I SAM-dependent methyltransferase [Vicinamibacteria bacterium]|nr:class I SAM-dependent methyltransferase [Vicinamibacteria bacterium]
MFHPRGPTFWELAEQALSSTERGYDLLAPKFDVTPFRTPDEILSRAANYVHGALKPRRLLDLGCGTGAVLQALNVHRAVGLDLSRGMLAVARKQVPHAVYVRGDFLEPPFASAFDLVTCFSALGHVLPTDGERFVKAVRTCLRPQGHFLFVTSRMPPLGSRGYWLSRGFNAAMHLRNTMWSPPFVMYYLTFVLPEARALLESEGFEVRVESGVFGAPFERYCLVEARLPR